VTAVRCGNIRETLADLKPPSALEAVDEILAAADCGSVTKVVLVDRFDRRQP
jgi:hypothetical protein